MIRHQDVAMDPGLIDTGMQLKPVQKLQVVVFDDETWLPIVTTLNDVQWHAGEYDSVTARHVGPLQV
jgi:hypothetical protein